MKKIPKKQKAKKAFVGVGESLKIAYHPCKKRSIFDWFMKTNLSRAALEERVIEIDSPLFVGYAVRIGSRTECWAYDPAMLTKKQFKLLGVSGWKKIEVYVGENDRG